MWQGNMTSCYIWSSADDSSKWELQDMETGENISPSPSQLLQGDVGMGELHSLLAKYVSAER